MPKIKDLGINAIPETMRPPEVGPGGGCHACTYSPAACGCPHTTFAGVCGCSNTTFVAQGYGQCCYCGAGCHPHTGCVHASHLCPPNEPCLDCPNCTAICNGTTFAKPHAAGYAAGYACVDDKAQPCAGTTFPPPYKGYRGGLTRESIVEIKQQLQRKIDDLDEYARNLGPKTAEEIDTREKELKAELDELHARRKELDKKK